MAERETFERGAGGQILPADTEATSHRPTGPARPGTAAPESAEPTLVPVPAMSPRDTARPRTGSPLRRWRWYQRLHAWVLAIGSARYQAAVDQRLRRLFGGLRGDVLEIGPGSGRNLAYFDSGVRWFGVEPNPFARDYLREETARLGLTAEVLDGTAEWLPVADASMDAVAASLVLCTVPDVDAALAEVRRVLRPGGRFVFIEHVAAPAGTPQRRWQTLFRRPHALLADGCQLDRETWTAIERAGFSATDITHFRLPIPLVGPHIAGTAVR